MPIVRIRESPYYRGSFLKKIHENFVRTLETVHNNRVVCIREVSVLLESLLHLEDIAENIFNNVIFFFYHLKGVRNLHLRGYSIHNPFIKVWSCQFV